MLCADGRVQLEFGSLRRDEIAARFSHRLVSIHAFANGNGGHSRTIAGLLQVQPGAARCSWGARDLAHAGEVRPRYLRALRRADEGDYAALLGFARS